MKLVRERMEEWLCGEEEEWLKWNRRDAEKPESEALFQSYILLPTGRTSRLSRGHER